MELKTFVKVGNISNLSDARYCAGFGVNMLGFNLDTNDADHITVDTAREIMGWVAVDSFVLECGQMTAEEVKSLARDFDIKNVQVDDENTASELAKSGLAVILRTVIHDSSDIDGLNALLATHSHSKYILIESETTDFTYNNVSAIQSANCELLKGFDVTSSNVLEGLDNSAFSGIALKGSVEEKAGFKDYDELAEILEQLEVEI